LSARREKSLAFTCYRKGKEIRGYGTLDPVFKKLTVFYFVYVTGPKNFQLDRLMAIFYSIVEENVAPSASILCQISSLVSLNLLTQITPDDQIDCPKYKCLVNFLSISEIAKQLQFDIVQYLYDFV